ncbi:MAG TPA: hypothetical protein VNM14_02715 [Planctomycetota bacterium]|jgi:hypothetical protein|nr:hypothetical protein [Planctomycetota bacterium]
MSIVALLLSNAAALLGAHALLRRVRTGEASTDVVLFLLLRIGLISLAVLVMGAAKLLSPTAIAAAGALATGALLALREHRHLPRPRLPEVGTGALLVAAVLILRSLLQVWFFAPFQRDAHTYHLPKIGEWILHSGFTAEWGLDLRSTHPSGFELVETWWVAPLRHDVLIEMAGLEFLLLGAAAVFDLARRLEIAPRFAFLAALLHTLTPGICLQATSCLNDGAAAALWIATAALTFRSVPATLLLLPLGLGTGVKPTYVYALPGLAIVGAIVARQRPLWTRSTLAVGVAALAVGASWYVRNWIVYGNPLYPVGLSGLVVHDGHVAQRLGPSLSGLAENLYRAFDSRIYDHLGPHDPELTWISGWGCGALAVGLVPLFLALRNDRRMRWLAGAYAVSLVCVCSLIVPDPWNMRYVLFFPSLFALAAAKVAESLRPVATLAWAAIGIQFLSTMIPGKFPVCGVSDLASQSWRERGFYKYPILDGVEEIGFLENQDDEVKCYSLYRPDFSRRVVLLRADSADGLMDALRREKLTRLYCPSAHRLTQQCMDEGRLKRIGAGLFQVP